MDAEEVGHLNGINIIDRMSDQAMVVEAADEAMDRHSASLSGWSVHREIRYPVPGPHRVRIGG